MIRTKQLGRKLQGLVVGKVLATKQPPSLLIEVLY